MDRLKVLGMMSGTSLDGVDAAVIETDGHQVYGFGPTAFRAYDEGEQNVLRAALGRWPGEAGVQAAADLIVQAHRDVLDQFGPVDLVGFHGQTLAHDPAGRRTHQAGDGALLARLTGRSVAWNFREADVAAGGQGAPFAPAYHFALAQWMEAADPVAFLNLGGVGNLTWIDPAKGSMAESGALIAFDTGPANAPINDAMLARRGVGFDVGGAVAGQGVVEESIVQSFLQHPYFQQCPPKSLDRDAFSDLSANVEALADAEAMATLTAAAAACVGQAMRFCPRPPQRILVTGGGRKNPVLMRMIAERLSCPIDPVEEVGLDGDMLEAQAFAFLAARMFMDLPLSFPGTTGVEHPTAGGIITHP
ncbi:MAG: anhydro-N-acetylmuramic acid kinase [Pseudomonadota bacterium]